MCADGCWILEYSCQLDIKGYYSDIACDMHKVRGPVRGQLLQQG